MTNDRTAARTGIANATALFAERRIRSDLTYLKRVIMSVVNPNREYEVVPYLISFLRYSAILLRNGTSHAKNFMTFIPPRSSCRSFARLSRCMRKFRCSTTCQKVHLSKPYSSALAGTNASSPASATVSRL